MLYRLLRPLLSAQQLTLERRLTKSVTAARRVFETSFKAQRYPLGDRVWQLSRQPTKWNLSHGLRIRITGVITLFRNENELQAWRAMYVSATCTRCLADNRPKAAFYAVKSGREPGIYGTWTECEAQVKGFNAYVSCFHLGQPADHVEQSTRNSVLEQRQRSS